MNLQEFHIIDPYEVLKSLYYSSRSPRDRHTENRDHVDFIFSNSLGLSSLSLTGPCSGSLHLQT